MKLFPKLIFLGVLWFSIAGLQGATITVTNATDAALRTAIKDAAPGDTVSINIGFTPLYLTNELVIDKDLHLLGRGRDNTAISANNSNRVFRIERGNVSVSNLRIMEANSGFLQPPYGGAILNKGILTVKDCYFLFNRSLIEITNNNLGVTNWGGAIYNGGTATIEDSVFDANSSSSDGGAIFNSGTASVVRSDFTRNTAQNAGGGIGNAGTLVLKDSTFLENLVWSTGGGGLGNRTNGTATVVGCKFINNTNDAYGGGAILNLGTIVVSNSVLAANSANRDSNDPVLSGGGGLYNSGWAYVYNSSIGPGNEARRGGGILNAGNSLNCPARLVMVGSTIYSNSVSMFGGGLLNGTLGGNATANLTNCTIAYNGVIAPSSTGGGIDNSSYAGSAIINLRNCTIFSNYIAVSPGIQSAGGIFTGKFGFGASDEAIINLGNTILSGNFVGSSFAYQGWATDGQLHSLGYNQCSDRFTPLTPTNYVMRVTNSFGRAMTNGATVLYPLVPGTPAIDKGDPLHSPAVDQRGLPRPFGAGFDVGALEQTLRFTKPIIFFGFGTPSTNVQVTFSPFLWSTNYLLESTTAIGSSNWTVVRSNISINPIAPWADITTIHPAGGNDRHRLYRVRVQP